MKKTWFLGIFLWFVIFFPDKTFAAVKINEVYPAPQGDDTEWIELYNNENTTIDISNYALIDLVDFNNKKDSKKITFDATTIEPFGFITAFSSKTLNNDKETIFLFLKDSFNDPIDTVLYEKDFDADDVFVRCPDGGDSWVILNLNTSTKKGSNQTACLTLTPTPTTMSPPQTPTPTMSPTAQNTPTPTANPTGAPVSHGNLYLSEVLPNPEEGNKEWVEIYNDNDSQVSLINWYIDDGENTGSAPKPFSLTIEAKDYGPVEMDGSFFNNDGDTVRLLDFNKVEKNRFTYPNSEKGKTYGRTSPTGADFCWQTPTRGAANASCPATQTAAPTPINGPTPDAITASNTATNPSPSPSATPTAATTPALIIVDSHTEKTVKPENTTAGEGEVLAATDENNAQRIILLGYTKGLSAAAAGISLLNIGYILRKIILRLKIHKS